ncbi:IS110 family RNA-guided transposase [Streptomyces violascens]|uniref:IS110 family transposase n=1 Tax=Streptomyces violascens TaxID=67381 RepID=UPI0036BC53BA
MLDGSGVVRVEGDDQMLERTFAGLDVHARSVTASSLDTETGEICSLKLSPKTDAVLAWVVSLPSPVAVAYEAGPTGFGLARALTGAGIRCVVVAPSKLERPPGDRIKTDRRDAERLARLLRIGELPAVRVPSVAEEAARDLVRAREDVRGDLMRARHRLAKLLLRQGLLWEGKTAWTQAHERWLRSLSFEQPGIQLAFDEAFDAALAAQSRRHRLEAAIEEAAASSPFAPVTGRLACLRGIGTLSAFGLAVEVGDWHRFTGASIGSYLGLVPSEASSGTRRSQGPITKTGNTHARRLLVEAAWHHRRPFRLGGLELTRRQSSQPPAVRNRANRGNRRLHRRWKRFDARDKRSTVAAVAVARELAGWCWSLAVMDEHDL